MHLSNKILKGKDEKRRKMTKISILVKNMNKKCMRIHKK